jgi:hypothetical protein
MSVEVILYQEEFRSEISELIRLIHKPLSTDITTGNVNRILNNYRKGIYVARKDSKIVGMVALVPLELGVPASVIKSHNL